ncbi:MAG: AAA family ATPase [Candidatus Atelocyanobacterium thalassa]
MDHFQQLIGQPQSVTLLKQIIIKNHIAPAYLFSGPIGVGRKLAAECFCKSLFSHSKVLQESQLTFEQRIVNGNHPDLYWIEPTYQHQKKLFTVKQAREYGLKRNSPPQIRVDQIRNIANFLSHLPLESIRSIVIIEEAELMTEAASNGLLKTLEEAKLATLILISSNPSLLLPTLVSRCQIIPFYNLSEHNLKEVLSKLNYENIINEEEIIKLSQGSPGKAISYWNKLQLIPSELKNTLKQIPLGDLNSLELSNKINMELDNSTQLFLIDYLQYFYWEKFRNRNLLELLELAKYQLLNYLNSRLVWDLLLMKISNVL